MLISVLLPLQHVLTRTAAAVFHVPPDVFESRMPMIAPLPKSQAEMAHRQAVNDILSSDSVAWESNEGFFDLQDQASDSVYIDEKMDGQQQQQQQQQHLRPRQPSTYGEITPLGARQLFYFMGMSNNNNNNKDEQQQQEIVFVDMGSGVGKLVMQAYMELPRVSDSIGIELSPLRHQRAVSAWGQIETSARGIRFDGYTSSSASFFGANGGGGGSTTTLTPTIPEATVELMEGDIMKADVSTATHLYVSSLCFTDDMMYQLAAKLERECPNLQSLASLRPLPKDFDRQGILDRISYQVVTKTLGMTSRLEYVEMSWTKRQGHGCAVYIYTKPKS